MSVETPDSTAAPVLHNFPADFQEDTAFVNAALASFLDRTGLPPSLQFHELLTADQCRVLEIAQQLKREARR